MDLYSGTSAGEYPYAVVEGIAGDAARQALAIIRHRL